MTEDEITNFNKEREFYDNKTGTTIIFSFETETDKFNESITVLRQNFNSSNNSKYSLCYKTKQFIQYKERFDIIFGKFNVNIKLNDATDASYSVNLELYNYFCGESHKYYKGLSRDRIHVYSDNSGNNIYVWEKTEDEFYHFDLAGKGYSKTKSQINLESHKYSEMTKIGEFIITNGMRKNNKIMNEQHPNHLCKSQLGQDLGDYDNMFFETKLSESKSSCRFDMVKADFAKVSIERNGQVINWMKLPNFKTSSARGDIKSLLKTIYLRTEISYEVYSQHSNKLDKIIGIQSNKNQLNVDVIPVPLIRLIEDIKTNKILKIIFLNITLPTQANQIRYLFYYHLHPILRTKL